MKAAGGQDPGPKYRHGGHRSRGVRASALGANSIPHAGAPTSFGTSLLGILSRSFPWCRGKPRGWFRPSCHDGLSTRHNPLRPNFLRPQRDSGRRMVFKEVGNMPIHMAIMQGLPPSRMACPVAGHTRSNEGYTRGRTIEQEPSDGSCFRATG